MIRIFLFIFFIAQSFSAYAQTSDVDRQKAVDATLSAMETFLDDSASVTNKKRVVSTPVEVLKIPCVHKKAFELAFVTDAFNYKTGSKWPYYYAQNYTTSDKVEKNGSLYGAYASWSWNGPVQDWHHFWQGQEIPNFAKIEVQMSEGKSDYSSYVTGKLKGFNAWNMDDRLLLGYDFKGNARTDFKPYLGLGYERFSDKDGGWVDYFVNNYAQYTTITSLWYLPLGLQTHTQLNEQWDVDAHVEADFVIDGDVAYHLNNIQGTFTEQDVNTGALFTATPLEADSHLRGGGGFRTSLKFIRKFKYFNFYLEPYFKFLYLNESQKVQAKMLNLSSRIQYVSVYPNKTAYNPLWDAKSTTLDVGVRAGVQF